MIVTTNLLVLVAKLMLMFLTFKYHCWQNTGSSCRSKPEEVSFALCCSAVPQRLKPTRPLTGSQANVSPNTPLLYFNNRFLQIPLTWFCTTKASAALCIFWCIFLQPLECCFPSNMKSHSKGKGGCVGPKPNQVPIPFCFLLHGGIVFV